MAKAAATAEKVKSANGGPEAVSTMDDGRLKKDEDRASSLVPRDSSFVSVAQADLQKRVSAQSIELAEAVPPASSVEGANAGKLDVILDMNVPVTVTIGQAEIPVRRLLQLGPGSVLKLDKPIEAPVDLFLKETKFATGDVVVVDNRFAVRIRQIIGGGN